MQTTQQKAWRAGRFWWDWPRPVDAEARPPTTLGAVVFDLDALADLDGAGHLPAFNAAFAELNLGIRWSLPRYRQLQALPDERRRVAAELRKRGIGTECDVLTELLVDEICATKDMILAETILDADLAPRAGLAELIGEAFGAGVSVGIAARGSHAWVEPLVRQLVGDGVVTAVVTTDDAPDGNPYRALLSELGITARQALAFTGSPVGRRLATSAGLPIVAVEADGTPMRMVDCRRLRDGSRPLTAEAGSPTAA